MKDFGDTCHRTVRIALRDLLNKNRNGFSYWNKHHQNQLHLQVECPLCGSLLISGKGEDHSDYYIFCYNCGAKEDA